jgi:carbamoylphosphate synthase large subunit
MPDRPEDLIEARVQNALKTLADNPEHNELRAAVAHMIEDRRKLQDRRTPFEDVVEEIGQVVEEATMGAERAADTVRKEAGRVSAKARRFMGSLRKAVEDLKDEP